MIIHSCLRVEKMSHTVLGKKKRKRKLTIWIFITSKVRLTVIRLRMREARFVNCHFFVI